MGLWDSIKKIGSDIVDGIGGGLLDLGSGFAEDWFADNNAKEAWERSKNMYDTRYQRTMKDMEKAGLNPILAAGSGGFNIGQGPQATIAQTGARNMASSAQSLAQTGLAEEQQTTEQIEQLKKMAEVKSEIARKYKIRAETGKIGEEERRVWFEIEKLSKEGMAIMKRGFRDYQDKKRLGVLTQHLEAQLAELQTMSEIYNDSAGQMIKYLQEIRQALGINVGVGIVR